MWGCFAHLSGNNVELRQISVALYQVIVLETLLWLIGQMITIRGVLR
jgi:hypothetical protein